MGKNKTKKKIPQTSELNKATTYNINIWKSITIPYTTLKIRERLKIKNTVSFTVSPKKTKYLGICLTKHI